MQEQWTLDSITIVSKPLKFSVLWMLALLLLPLTAGCDRAAVQTAFSADPNASRWGNAQGQLPVDFPSELRYPNSELQAARSDNRQATQGQATKGVVYQTRWLTSTSGESVQTFYRQLFQRPEWQLINQESNSEQTVLQARKQALNVTVTIPNGVTTFVPRNQQGANPAAPTSTLNVPVIGFTLTYYRTPTNADTSNTESSKPAAQPGDPNFIGPVAKSSPLPSPTVFPTETQPPPTAFTDLKQAPEELQPYLEDLAELGVLSGPGGDNDPDRFSAFQPNQAIQRGTFARWLVQANNRLYRDRPTQQIRLATDTAKPAFKDVPPFHPDFPYIQGLAEAGYLPSPLSGDQDQILFRPDQDLTRATLLTWKVPVDRRQILPTATAAKVKQVWGFKDASRIAPAALSAVLADHSNGDLANIRRLLGSALLFQPQKPATRAEAAATLWFIGIEGEGYSAQDIRRAEQQSAASSS